MRKAKEDIIDFQYDNALRELESLKLKQNNPIKNKKKKNIIKAKDKDEDEYDNHEDNEKDDDDLVMKNEKKNSIENKLLVAEVVMKQLYDKNRILEKELQNNTNREDEQDDQDDKVHHHNNIRHESLVIQCEGDVHQVVDVYKMECNRLSKKCTTLQSEYGSLITLCSRFFSEKPQIKKHVKKLIESLEMRLQHTTTEHEIELHTLVQTLKDVENIQCKNHVKLKHLEMDNASLVTRILLLEEANK